MTERYSPAWVGNLQDKIAYLERLLDRAYPLLHNPYRETTDAFNWALYDSIIHEVEQAIAHLKEEDDPERIKMPCGSCDGVGCPNCAAP